MILLKVGCEKLDIHLFRPVIYTNNPARMALISNLSKHLEMLMELCFLDTQIILHLNLTDFIQKHERSCQLDQ